MKNILEFRLGLGCKQRLSRAELEEINAERLTFHSFTKNIYKGPWFEPDMPKPRTDNLRSETGALRGHFHLLKISYSHT